MQNSGARRGATIFIFVTVLIDMLTFGMIGPVLPKLIAGFVGNDYAHAAEIIGLFATVWAVMQFFASPFLGMLSDKVGRRPVILLSNAVSVIDLAIMAMAPNLWWLFAGRVLSGVASANMTAASAYIADVTPPEKRAAGIRHNRKRVWSGIYARAGDRRRRRQHQSAPDVLGGRRIRTDQLALRPLCSARIASARAADAAYRVETRQSGRLVADASVASRTLGPELGEPRNLCRA